MLAADPHASEVVGGGACGGCGACMQKAGPAACGARVWPEGSEGGGPRTLEDGRVLQVGRVRAPAIENVLEGGGQAQCQLLCQAACKLALRILRRQRICGGWRTCFGRQRCHKKQMGGGCMPAAHVVVPCVHIGDGRQRPRHRRVGEVPVAGGVAGYRGGALVPSGAVVNGHWRPAGAPSAASACSKLLLGRWPARRCAVHAHAHLQ